MPISPRMNAKLNEQVANEFFASQLYLAIACYFDDLGLRMLARHYRKQTEEERAHALKIVDYIPQVQGTVKIGAIPEPQQKFESVLAAIEAALAHEHKVTAQVNDLMALAEEEKDYATASFLKWFIDEQVEEVDQQAQLAKIAKMVGPHVVNMEAYMIHMHKA